MDSLAQIALLLTVNLPPPIRMGVMFLYFSVIVLKSVKKRVSPAAFDEEP